jgi:uncharacterized protein (DUF302 family)
MIRASILTRRTVAAALAAALLSAGGLPAGGLPTALAAEVAPLRPLPGWEVRPTDFSYDQLLARLKDAVAAEGMVVVTEAGPTQAAAARGVEIPGNRVVGVFRNDFAVRALALSTAAMIEAPIRFYVTEDDDGTATLSWKTPGFVLAPYVPDAGPALDGLATELDLIFAGIAERAVTGRD